MISGTTRSISNLRENPPSMVMAANRLTDIMRPKAGSSSKVMRSFCDDAVSTEFSSIQAIAIATCSKSSFKTALRAFSSKLYGAIGTNLSSRAVPISTRSA